MNKISYFVISTVERIHMFLICLIICMYVYGYFLLMMIMLTCVLNVLTVRLVDGPTKYEGRVEVFYNGIWGTVCDDGWDLREAEVICTELGLGEALAAIPSAFYGQGSGQILLDDVNCVGNEGTIANCLHSGLEFHNCSHKNDASVNCTAGTYVICFYIHMYVRINIMYMCN